MLENLLETLNRKSSYLLKTLNIKTNHFFFSRSDCDVILLRKKEERICVKKEEKLVNDKSVTAS